MSTGTSRLVASYICCTFKKISLTRLILYIFFFIIVYMYIAPGSKFWNLLSLRSFATSFKKNLFEVWFYTFFFFSHDFIHVYSPGAGDDSPLGTKFWWQQELLDTSVICCKFQKKSLWSLILYPFFHDFIHVYSPGAGADSPQGTKFWFQQKCLVTSFICCKFQNNVFEVWFYTIFFMI